MSIFTTTPRENTFVSSANTDTCLSNTSMCVLGTDDEVPPLSGALLAEKLLEMNRYSLNLEIYREKLEAKKQIGVS